MSEKPSQISENQRVAFMTAIAEAAHLLRHAAEPRRADDSVKSLIARAARAVGISAARAKALWYGEAHTVRAEEMDRLRAVAAKRRANEEAASHELDELMDRVARLEERLVEIDPNFHGPFVDALRHAMRGRL